MSFDIPLKNAILEPKHFSAMGKALWLYVFLLDKTTSIDKDGTGRVLGGKPLTYEKDIKPVFPITRQTYYKWLAQLEAYPYIVTTRTPHGISFRVLKVHKVFGGRSKQNLTSVKSDVKKSYSDVNKSLHGSKQNLTSIYRQYKDNTKTMDKFVEKQETRSTESEAKERIRAALKTRELKKLKQA